MGAVISGGKPAAGTHVGGRWLAALIAAALLAGLGLGIVLSEALNGTEREAVRADAMLTAEQERALLTHIGELSDRLTQLEREAGGLAGQMGTLKEFEARMRMDDVVVSQGPRARVQPASSDAVGGVFLADQNAASDQAAQVSETVLEENPPAAVGSSAVETDSQEGARVGADVISAVIPDFTPDAPATLPGYLVQPLSSAHDNLYRLAHVVADLAAYAENITRAHDAFPGRRPVKAEDSWISSAFGQRRDPFNTRLAFHSGVDFAAYRGTPIYASAGGKVVFAGNRPAYGKTVEVDHGNGMVTRYAHAQSILVKKSQWVEPGQLLARVGSTGRTTGSHLHFEIIKNGHFVDPAPYLARF